jgi:hypothetical protein
MTAHEQQNERVVLSSWASSGGGTTFSSGAVSRTAFVSRRRRADSDRMASVSLRAATWMSQARGSSGTPVRGHWNAAAVSASWTASSAVSKSP